MWKFGETSAAVFVNTALFTDLIATSNKDIKGFCDETKLQRNINTYLLLSIYSLEQVNIVHTMTCNCNATGASAEDRSRVRRYEYICDLQHSPRAL